MNADAYVRRLAASQNGIVTGTQLRSYGLSDKQIHLRRKRGDLVLVLPGVFRVGAVPDSYEARLRAVAAWIQDRGFFNSSTAGYLYELDGIDRPDRISIARYSGVACPSWLRIHRLEAGDAPPIRRVKGFRVCCVERALAECAATVPARLVGRALDDALRRRLTTLGRMRAFAKTWGRGRRGATVLGKLLKGRDEQDERVRSRFESKMLTVLRRIPGHRFVANFCLSVEGATYFLDFYNAAARLAIECHSFKWHIGRHNEDARRDRRIRSLGIEIMYFTWDDVVFQSDEVERVIRSAIARRTGIFSSELPQEARIAEEF